MRLLVLFLVLLPFVVQAQPADFYLEGNKYVTASIIMGRARHGRAGQGRAGHGMAGQGKASISFHIKCT